MCWIFIVDDHITSREAVIGLLESEGHTHAEASNGREALDWLMAQTELPCIILLDLRMPVMDGWDFLHAVRSVPKWAGIPVIVASGTIEQDHPQPVLPAMAFWSKPLQAEKIRSLHRFCGRHRNTWKRPSGS